MSPLYFFLPTDSKFIPGEEDIENYVQDLESKGFAVDSTYNFKDLRGGQKGTGDQQALLVWSASGMDLGEVISALQDITPRLPYS